MEDKPDNSEKAIIVRSKVEPKANYRAYKENLRFDFYYSCCYCTIMEIEAAGVGFTIDHYYPKKHSPELEKDYNNLMWSCERCNNYKSDFYPDEDDISRGHEVIRPDHEDPQDHFTVNQYRLKGKTSKGGFNIERLDLNRAHLRRLRKIREELWESSKFIGFGVQQLLKIRIDRVSPRKRLNFQKIQRAYKDRLGQIDERREDFIRNLARSFHLDDDPEKAERHKARRDFLRKGKAIMPD